MTEGKSYLGACCYRNEAEFRVDPYFEDMKIDALAEMNDNIADAFEALAPLLVE